MRNEKNKINQPLFLMMSQLGESEKLSCLTSGFVDSALQQPEGNVDHDIQGNQKERKKERKKETKIQGLVTRTTLRYLVKASYLREECVCMQ
ncbi:unnamed protein product [Paramecium pentaurelia]|uniref:Uncharacterized protein n=1 Tax=Paramecium pentaurelia TaxID=43138 RepID=A0A8S1XSC3_9CILI|nr:unnamed protein product [Paramecium pentaurelia]